MLKRHGLVLVLGTRRGQLSGWEAVSDAQLSGRQVEDLDDGVLELTVGGVRLQRKHGLPPIAGRYTYLLLSTGGWHFGGCGRSRG